MELDFVKQYRILFIKLRNTRSRTEKDEIIAEMDGVWDGMTDKEREKVTNLGIISDVDLERAHSCQ